MSADHLVVPLRLLSAVCVIPPPPALECHVFLNGTLLSYYNIWIPSLAFMDDTKPIFDGWLDKYKFLEMIIFFSYILGRIEDLPSPIGPINPSYNNGQHNTASSKVDDDEDDNKGSYYTRYSSNKLWSICTLQMICCSFCELIFSVVVNYKYCELY